MIEDSVVDCVDWAGAAAAVVSLCACPNSSGSNPPLKSISISQSPRVTLCFATVLHNIIGFIRQLAASSGPSASSSLAAAAEFLRSPPDDSHIDSRRRAAKQLTDHCVIRLVSLVCFPCLTADGRLHNKPLSRTLNPEAKSFIPSLLSRRENRHGAPPPPEKKNKRGGN